MICDKKKCVGCGACANICPVNAISMQIKDGFLYPHIDEDICINCEACIRVCPVLKVEEKIKVKQYAFIFQHADEQILMESTSGGAFSALGNYVIRKRGVVFGATFDSEFNVVHDYAEKIEELVKFRNSKYVQSNICDCYSKVKNFLDTKRLVLFSGTPCQIEGLLSYLGSRDLNNLLLVDVVCRACPSPLFWQKYKEYMVLKYGKLKAVEFRNKRKYGYEYSQIHMSFENGYEYWNGVESDPYLRAFFGNYSDRESCYKCQFKHRNRKADLTIWDCYTIHRFSKKLDNNKGVTRILTHSEKGIEIINNIMKEENCLEQVDLEEAVRGVREMTQSVPENAKRCEFITDIEKMVMEDIIEKYFPDTKKVKLERFFRRIFERIGIYRYVKRVVNFLRGRKAY